MLSEVGRRTGKHRGAEVRKSCLQLCIDKAGIDLPVEPVDDFALARTSRACDEAVR
jgi:hypothetical protein